MYEQNNELVEPQKSTDVAVLPQPFYASASEPGCVNYSVDTLIVDARNVGVARSCGAEYLLAACVRWLAFTDADSQFRANGWVIDSI